jgi:hypothetical protein
MNLTITNKNFTGLDLPYFSSSSSTSKTISSNLTGGVNVQIIMNVDSCDNLGNIYYTPSGGQRVRYRSGDFTCSNNIVTFSSLAVNPSSNVFEIDYSCSSYTLISYKLIMILASLVIVMVYAFWVYNKGLDGFELKDLIIGAAILFIVITFWMAAGQNLGNSCPVIT